MPENRQIIISDTSCLIILKKTGHLSLLKNLFGEVSITQKIAEEYGESLPQWIRIVEPDEASFKAIAQMLDTGEASAIAYALEHENCLLIIDDIKARKYAKALGLTVTGTLGVIARAQKEGKITSALALIEQIQNTDFRLSTEVLARIRKELE